MRLLLLAPHQDDEVLSAGGIIQQFIEHNSDVSILFATNGDRFGVDIARQRYEESCYALAELGVSASNIFYMGYGDTGMLPERSFLFRLHAAPPNTFLSSYVSEVTYHPAGEKTIRTLRMGANGPMCKAAFLSDLAWAIQEIRPDFILCPSLWDTHGDHVALAMLLHEILPASAAGASYLIHGGDDISWPQRGTDTFQKPIHLPSEIWKRRIVVKLSDKQRDKKRRLIECFSTQIATDTSGFLPAFAKYEEFFLPWDTTIQQKR